MIKKFLLASTLGLALSLPAQAEFPSNWYVEGVQELLEGNVVSTSIQADGSLALSAELKPLARLKETGILDAARLSDGRLVVGTSQEGAVYLLTPGQADPKPLLKLGRDLITAVAVDKNGRIYAASAPDGRIYAGTASEGLKPIYTGKEGYIWDILTLPDGKIYFVTGNSGALYELKGDKAELLYRSQESNLRSLHYDSKWGLVVGGGSKAVVYRYLGNQRMEAIHEGAGDEITSITGDGKGHLFIAANRAQVQANQNKSTVYHVDPAGHSEILFPLAEETVYGLALDTAGTLFVGTGNAGRIYTVLHPLATDKRTLSLPARSQAGQVSALVPGPDKRMFVLGSGPATIEEYQGRYRSAGIYETTVLSPELPASWGMLHVNSVLPQGTQIVAWSRSGNTQTPDATWSEWSKAYTNPEEVRIESPRGRHLQLKFELRTQNEAVTPRLHSFEVSYLRDNLAPLINQVFFLQRGIYFTPHTVGSLEGPRSLEITPQVLSKLQRPQSSEEIYDALMSEKTSPPMRMVQKFRTGMLTVAWDAEDANSDQLRYDVYYQAYGQNEWRPLATDLTQPIHSFDTASLVDGRYHFRVYAKDALSNPGNGYKVFRDSELILIDNTAPAVRNLKARLDGKEIEVSFEAEDQLSPLAYAEYAIDGQIADLLQSSDRIVDGRVERFVFRIPAPGKGPHNIVVKVSDRLGNSVTGKAAVEVP